MKLTLTVYTDDTLTEIKRVVEADRVKIPYRTAIYIISSLEGKDIKNTDDIFNFVMSSLDKLDKIIKATFGVSELELDCIDISELGSVAVFLLLSLLTPFGILFGLVHSPILYTLLALVPAMAFLVCYLVMTFPKKKNSGKK